MHDLCKLSLSSLPQHTRNNPLPTKVPHPQPYPLVQSLRSSLHDRLGEGASQEPLQPCPLLDTLRCPPLPGGEHLAQQLLAVPVLHSKSASLPREFDLGSRDPPVRPAAKEDAQDALRRVLAAEVELADRDRAQVPPPDRLGHGRRLAGAPPAATDALQEGTEQCCQPLPSVDFLVQHSDLSQGRGPFAALALQIPVEVRGLLAQQAQVVAKLQDLAAEFGRVGPGRRKLFLQLLHLRHLLLQLDMLIPELHEFPSPLVVAGRGVGKVLLKRPDRFEVVFVVPLQVPDEDLLPVREGLQLLQPSNERGAAPLHLPHVALLL
mmetsp:Transcript_38917/g.102851  ORF Transcript_38917/g.102851 Transcript_38917/m.102851 type:complete len:321 (-) Transcript_38917:63-1025(-)